LILSEAGRQEVIEMKRGLPQEIGLKRRAVTLILIAAGCAFLAAALLVGIADNPPGLVLVYLAVIAWILALAHRWRRVRSFLILLGASLGGFPLAVVLHNLFYALGIVAVDAVVLQPLLGFLEVVFFLIAVFVCPPGAVIGAVGGLVLAVRQWKGARTSDQES
jgi:hypothetical protein